MIKEVSGFVTMQAFDLFRYNSPLFFHRQVILTDKFNMTTIVFLLKVIKLSIIRLVLAKYYYKITITLFIEVSLSIPLNHKECIHLTHLLGFELPMNTASNTFLLRDNELSPQYSLVKEDWFILVA